MQAHTHKKSGSWVTDAPTVGRTDGRTDAVGCVKQRKWNGLKAAKRRQIRKDNASQIAYKCPSVRFARADGAGALAVTPALGPGAE